MKGRKIIQERRGLEETTSGGHGAKGE